MTILLACLSSGRHEPAVKTWQETAPGVPIVIDDCTEGEGAGYLGKLQKVYKESTEDIIAYFHADLFIHEKGWVDRVLKEFEDERVAIVSFGGATRHGVRDIYKIGYDFRQLARSGWMSNLRDAEKHGKRETGSAEVAVVDSFSLIVRRNFLDRVGGFPVATLPPSHCSDYWACLMAHRFGCTIRMVGVDCTHNSGGVNLGTFNYPKWCKTTKWLSDAEMHRVGHRMIYDEFRDILPVEVS